MFSQYPRVHENAIIYCNLNGKMKSVDLDKMQPNWEYDFKTKVFVSPTIFGDKVIVNLGYYLSTVNAKNGQLITNVKFNHPLPHEPVVSDGEIFVMDEKGNAFCFDQNLNTKWQFQVNNYVSDTKYDENTQVSEVIETSINTLTNLVAGEKLIVLGDSEHIIGVDKKNGEMLWLVSIPIIDWSSPDDIALVKKNLGKDQNLDNILNNKVGTLKSLQIINHEVVANTSSCIAVYDSDNGELKRKKFFFNNEIIGGIKAVNDFYYYVRKDGVLYKLNKTLEKETIVYKEINYKPDSEYTNPYIQIQ